MAFVLTDRIKETTTTTGTGDITLAGAATGFEAFSAQMANGDTTKYCIQAGSEWEIGIGTWNTGGTLTRTAVLRSSNSDAAVNFSAGTKNVFMVDDAGGITPIGTVVDYAGTTAPTGWILCYGQTLNASTSPEYQALYDVIGNTYGGTNNTDFVVPDLRDRVVAGKGNMGGSAASRLTNQSGGLEGDTLGASGGSETHTLVLSQIPSHSHSIINTLGGSGSETGLVRDPSSASVVTNKTFSGSEGSDGAHNNVQPTFILNKIIKY